VSLYVLAPGEPMGMYHWEADQEDFFVLAGEALLLVEGEERPLREWDFVHCPPSTDHIIVGAGDAPAVTTTRSAAPSTYHAMPRTPDCSIAWRAVESWPFADVACGRGGGGGTGFTPNRRQGDGDGEQLGGSSALWGRGCVVAARL
jgi:oxalate decarboxylase/phosphoglucose isomerase-like protein (cupin superfamily)